MEIMDKKAIFRIIDAYLDEKPAVQRLEQKDMEMLFQKIKTAAANDYILNSICEGKAELRQAVNDYIDVCLSQEIMEYYRSKIEQQEK